MLVGSYLQTIAERTRRERLIRNIPQREMARRIGLSLRSYQKFESTGHIALDGFVKVLFVLGRQNELLNLLLEIEEYKSLDDLEQHHHQSLRQRARQKQADGR
jgi:transcriptional regulator with XRE-family HTH domain